MACLSNTQTQQRTNNQVIFFFTQVHRLSTMLPFWRRICQPDWISRIYKPSPLDWGQFSKKTLGLDFIWLRKACMLWLTHYPGTHQLWFLFKGFYTSIHTFWNALYCWWWNGSFLRIHWRWWHVYRSELLFPCKVIISNKKLRDNCVGR